MAWLRRAAGLTLGQRGAKRRAVPFPRVVVGWPRFFCRRRGGPSNRNRRASIRCASRPGAGLAAIPRFGASARPALCTLGSSSTLLLGAQAERQGRTPGLFRQLGLVVNQKDLLRAVRPSASTTRASAGADAPEEPQPQLSISSGGFVVAHAPCWHVPPDAHVGARAVRSAVGGHAAADVAGDIASLALAGAGRVAADAVDAVAAGAGVV